jgi:hypothetical protein
LEKSIGMRRTTPLVSAALRLIPPMPRAASFSSGRLATAPGIGDRIAVGSVPATARPERTRGQSLRSDGITANPKDGRRILESACKDLVVIREPRHQSSELLRLAWVSVFHVGHEALGRRSIRLREQSIEADNDGAEIDEAAGQFGQARPRPRPLPQKRERSFVDVDDADRRILIIPRAMPLIDVERSLADGLYEGGVQDPDPGERHRCQHRDHYDQCGPP